MCLPLPASSNPNPIKLLLSSAWLHRLWQQQCLSSETLAAARYLAGALYIMNDDNKQEPEAITKSRPSLSKKDRPLCPFHARRRLAMDAVDTPAQTTTAALGALTLSGKPHRPYLRHDIKSHSIDQPDAQLTSSRPSSLQEQTRRQHVTFYRQQQQARIRKNALATSTNAVTGTAPTLDIIDVPQLVPVHGLAGKGIGSLSQTVSIMAVVDLNHLPSAQQTTSSNFANLEQSADTTMRVPWQQPQQQSADKSGAGHLTPNPRSFPYLNSALSGTVASPTSTVTPAHQYPTMSSMFAHSKSTSTATGTIGDPPYEAVRISDVGDGYVYLNQYKLSNETLGHGTYSIVKLAYNTEDNTHYAMKILSKKKLMKKHRMSRKTGDPMQEAYREIAILKKLNHPNIIRLIEVLDDPNEDSLYMAFELLERGEVLVVPTESPLPETVAWTYFRDLLLGVEYLHHNGILHRDLKPSNLLLDDNGHLKIADFGLSHMFEGADALLTSTAGTPAFHAPEILSQAQTQSGNSSPGTAQSLSRSGSLKQGSKGTPTGVSGVAMDVWSMGVTLFSLVFGDVPFRDDMVIELYNQIRSFPPTFPETVVISDALRDLLLRLLEKNPEKRMTINEMRDHTWITRGETQPITRSREDNCTAPIKVTDQEIQDSVRSIPHLDTLILIKAMLKRGSFHHPFKIDLADTRKGSLDSNLPPADP